MSNLNLLRVRSCLAPAVAALLCVAGVRAQSFDECYRQALAAESAGKLQEALASVDQAIAADRDRDEGHQKRGEILWKLGRFEEARRSFAVAKRILKEKMGINENSLAEMYRQANVQCDRAQESLDRRDYDVAKEHLLIAQELAPDLPRIADLLAKLPERARIEVTQITQDRQDAARVREQFRQQSSGSAGGFVSVTAVRDEMDRMGMPEQDRQTVEDGIRTRGLAGGEQALRDYQAKKAEFDPPGLLIRAESALEKGDVSELARVAGQLASDPLYVRDAMRYADQIRRQHPSEAASIYEVVATSKSEFRQKAQEALDQLAIAADATVKAAPAGGRQRPAHGQAWAAHFGIPMLYVAPQAAGSGGLRPRKDVASGYWVAERPPTREEWMQVMRTEVWPTSGTLSGGTMQDLVTDGVTYGQAVRFCEALTKLDVDAGLLPEGYRYTLPTEAEYELAQGMAGRTAASRYGSAAGDGSAWDWCLGSGNVWVARCGTSDRREMGTGATWMLAPRCSFRLVLAHRGDS